jgi:YidC/Oxa1 family membrane protein insertase
VTAAQQKWINMQLEKEKDEDGKLMNGQSDDDDSDGFFARVMERARKAQEQQQKSS